MNKPMRAAALCEYLDPTACYSFDGVIVMGKDAFNAARVATADAGLGDFLFLERLDMSVGTMTPKELLVPFENDTPSDEFRWPLYLGRHRFPRTPVFKIEHGPEPKPAYLSFSKRQLRHWLVRVAGHVVYREFYALAIPKYVTRARELGVRIPRSMRKP